MNTREEIKFYSETGNWGEFSNFSLHTIIIKGEKWSTVEHYFQAQKFNNKVYQEKIRKSILPMKAAELGRSRKVKIKRNWDRMKENIMYEAVFAKFTQHQDLKKLLLKTEDAVLIEHTENDNYWGDGGNGKGKNKLGMILMKVRQNISKY